jgi:hypothetical protein
MKSAVLLLLSFPLCAADMTGLSWMTGCWAVEQGPVRIEEQWNKPAAGQMTGVARTIRSGKVMQHEFLLIDTEAQGIFYLPRISNGAEPVSSVSPPRARPRRSSKTRRTISRSASSTGRLMTASLPASMGCRMAKSGQWISR